MEPSSLVHAWNELPVRTKRDHAGIGFAFATSTLVVVAACSVARTCHRTVRVPGCWNSGEPVHLNQVNAEAFVERIGNRGKDVSVSADSGDEDDVGSGAARRNADSVGRERDPT